MEIVSLKVPSWLRYEGLLHGFAGRRGGTSRGPFAELNASYRVGDDAEAVSRNICDVKQAIGIHDGRVVTMKQVHGDRIVAIENAHVKETGEADGMVTRQANVFLGVLTADCVPIFIIAPQEKAAAAVHAGWRGSLAGIASKAVSYFADRFGIPPEALEAALGPSIGLCCYEVGDEVVEPLRARWGGLAADCIATAGSRQHVDLRRLNRALLSGAGIPPEHIFEVGPCTKCAADDFFSYRREKKETGRQLSVIGWQR